MQDGESGGTGPDHAAALSELFDVTDGVYQIGQLERCPRSDRLHLQGYLQLRERATLRRLQRQFAHVYERGVHLEPARGTPQENRTYCSKLDSRIAGPWEHGVFQKATQGRRSDLVSLQALIDGGASIRDIAEQRFPEFVKYHRGIERYFQLISPVRRWKTAVVIYQGPTGCGKTSRVYAEHDSTTVYCVGCPATSTTGVWFDGYRGEPVLLFDDFYSWIRYALLLRICDRHQLNLPVKFGSAQCLARVVYFTSNQSWEKWYPNMASTASFRRRIDWVVEWKQTLGGDYVSFSTRFNQ